MYERAEPMQRFRPFYWGIVGYRASLLQNSMLVRWSFETLEFCEGAVLRSSLFCCAWSPRAIEDNAFHRAATEKQSGRNQYRYEDVGNKGLRNPERCSEDEGNKREDECRQRPMNKYENRHVEA